MPLPSSSSRAWSQSLSVRYVIIFFIFSANSIYSTNFKLSLCGIKPVQLTAMISLGEGKVNPSFTLGGRRFRRWAGTWRGMKLSLCGRIFKRAKTTVGGAFDPINEKDANGAREAQAPGTRIDGIQDLRLRPFCAHGDFCVIGCLVGSWIG